MREDDVTVVDVRPAGECEAGPIPGALAGPMSPNRLKRGGTARPPSTTRAAPNAGRTTSRLANSRDILSPHPRGLGGRIFQIVQICDEVGDGRHLNISMTGSRLFLVVVPGCCY